MQFVSVRRLVVLFAVSLWLTGSAVAHAQSFESLLEQRSRTRAIDPAAFATVQQALADGGFENALTPDTLLDLQAAARAIYDTSTPTEREEFLYRLLAIPAVPVRLTGGGERKWSLSFRFFATTIPIAGSSSVDVTPRLVARLEAVFRECRFGDPVSDQLVLFLRRVPTTLETVLPSAFECALKDPSFLSSDSLLALHEVLGSQGLGQVLAQFPVPSTELGLERWLELDAFAARTAIPRVFVEVAKLRRSDDDRCLYRPLLPVYRLAPGEELDALRDSGEEAGLSTECLDQLLDRSVLEDIPAGNADAYELIVIP